MRNTDFSKIFLISLMFFNPLLASDTFDDDDDTTLTTRNSSTSQMTAPQEQPEWQINGLNGAPFMQIGFTNSESPAFHIFQQNGSSYYMTPQMLISCYLVQKSNYNNLANLWDTLTKQKNDLESAHERAQLRIGSLIEETDSLKKELLISKETSRKLSQECSELKKEKDELGRSVASLTATNTFLRNNDTNINKELAIASQSAERLLQEKLELQKHLIELQTYLEQLQQEHAGLNSELETMKYHSSAVVQYNEQLAAQLNMLTRQQQLTQGHGTTKFTLGPVVKPNSPPQT